MSMRAPLLRIPYTDPLPAPTIIPRSADTVNGAVSALVNFLSPSLSSAYSRPVSPLHKSNVAHALNASRSIKEKHGKTVLLTGAGISVASGLADYRGTNGTYTLNRKYRPIYFNEFCDNHEAKEAVLGEEFSGMDDFTPGKTKCCTRSRATTG